MEANNDLGWYEAGLPAQERKVRGHFSTPSQLVERILDACGYTPDRSLLSLRVLDPACGSGNFLVGAARRLIHAGKHLSLSDDAITTAIQHMLWGLDPDPVACFLAEMRLHELLSHEIPSLSVGERSTKDVARFHVHQADGLALQWEEGVEGRVDLFLANPPYLAAKNTDLSGYRSTQGRGQADSYLLFLDLALRVVRPGGWLALVLPDPVLARANATRERQRLLAQTTVHHLWHLAGVFAAHVGAVVIVAQKQAPAPQHCVSWTREKWSRSTATQPSYEYMIGVQGDRKGRPYEEAQPRDAAQGDRKGRPYEEMQSRSGYIPQWLFSRQPRAELRYLLNTRQDVLLERLRNRWRDGVEVRREEMGVSRFLSLGQLVTIRRGEELGKESPLLREHRPGDEQGWYPVLRGGVDVQTYTMISSPACWIAERALEKPLDRYLTPKLLVVKSTARLQAALDLQGYVVLQTLYVLTSNAPESDENELYFLLALLNSRLLQDYVYVLYTAYKWVQPQIEQHVLASLPVPRCEAAQKVPIIERARLLMHACSMPTPVVELKQEALYQEQECAIRALYEEVLQK